MKRLIFLLFCQIAAIAYSQSNPFSSRLDSSMIICSSSDIPKTMQGLDITNEGDIYITWEENHSMHVKRAGSFDQSMVLPVGGHGDCFSISHSDSNKTIFWTIGSLGEPMSNGGFMGGLSIDPFPKLICKYQYEAGTTRYPEDAIECYYLNDNGCRIVDIDEKNDIFLCWTIIDSLDYFIIYNLSELPNCKKIKLSIGREHNRGKEVEVSDLNSITPKASFPWNRMIACGSQSSLPKAVQGLCVNDGKIYVLTGYKEDTASTVSIIDFEGTIWNVCTPIRVSQDKPLLKHYALSEDGNFEPEGIHVYENYILIGFVGDFPSDKARKHYCIIKLER